MRRRSRRNQRTDRVSRLETSLSFTFPRGRQDPPRCVDSPAWPLVIQVRGSPTAGGTQQYNVNNIVTSLEGQLGFSDISTFNTKLSIRIKRMDVWTSAVFQPIALRVADLITGVYSQWVEDIGTPSTTAHVHAVWPRSQQQHWLSGTAKTPVAQVDHYAQADYTIHWHIDLQFHTGDPLPTYRRHIPDSQVTEGDPPFELLPPA